MSKVMALGWDALLSRIILGRVVPIAIIIQWMLVAAFVSIRLYVTVLGLSLKTYNFTGV